MQETSDGYEIAEKDLLQRGPGDFFSSIGGDNLRQSGGFEFRFAQMCDDRELFNKAFSSAKGLLEIDPELTLPEHAELKAELSRVSVINSSTVS